MKRLILPMLIFGFLLPQSGCISKNEVELYPCDTNKVSYSKHIVPILQTNCYRCHDVNNAVLYANGNYLDDYANLKAHIKAGLVIGNIEHDSGFIAMPKGAKQLNACEIAKIKAWIHQDTLNN